MTRSYFFSVILADDNPEVEEARLKAGRVTGGIRVIPKILAHTISRSFR